jgi:hypothetical protein
MARTLLINRFHLVAPFRRPGVETLAHPPLTPSTSPRLLVAPETLPAKLAAPVKGVVGIWALDSSDGE